MCEDVFHPFTSNARFSFFIYSLLLLIWVNKICVVDLLASKHYFYFYFVGSWLFIPNFKFCTFHVWFFFTFIQHQCKCFGAFKFIYYILLLTIPSYKSILISCGCVSIIYLFIYLFIFATIHLIGSSSKIYEIPLLK
jgi:hypothetical protein